MSFIPVLGIGCLFFLSLYVLGEFTWAGVALLALIDVLLFIFTSFVWKSHKKYAMVIGCMGVLLLFAIPFFPI